MKQFLTGNILLVLCCVFYLAWWLIAFKPVGAIKGIRSGWLLIPAAVFGAAAVLMICKGISETPNGTMLFPTLHAAAAGIILYVILLTGSWLIMRRPVTTELFLIVGWAVLASTEISALYGHGAYGRTAALTFIGCIIVMAVVSLVCYLLYYNLDSVKSYYDGMIPLVIVAVTTVIMSITMEHGSL